MGKFLKGENDYEPIKPTLVKTGIKSYFAEDEVLFLANRSSNPAKRGLVLANSVGIIDSDYRGNIHLILGNISNKPIELNIGERIAQMGVYKVTRISLYETDTLTETERGKGGLGSTGK